MLIVFFKQAMLSDEGLELTSRQMFKTIFTSIKQTRERAYSFKYITKLLNEAGFELQICTVT